ncbi:hypothetical protein [Mycobacterium haemophilum]|uniref:hypothetical protein n=1 Tax=Mycobacterium haemophilum TaxID=29311 RepID=UPI0012DFFE7C|nr:hypothetical protein [Mycobacterium haemophilum]MCV7342524.1 hypothetical protein [Mycobacterium haemophilum DSM 44634]
MQIWIGQSAINFDFVASIKAHTYDALLNILKGKPRQLDTNPHLMRKGVERC